MPRKKQRELRPSPGRLVLVSGRTSDAVYTFLNGIWDNELDIEFLALVDEIHKKNIEGHEHRG